MSLEKKLNQAENWWKLKPFAHQQEQATEMKILTKCFGVSRGRAYATWREKHVEYTRLMMFAKK